jgi:1-acyl-sn-glycerol-3-phosphate acyltransferase
LQEDAALSTLRGFMFRVAYSVSRGICRVVFGAVTHWRVFGLERTRLRGAWILASNHISHFDPLLITAAVPRKIDWMAMSDLFRGRLLGAWLRASDCFPVQRFKADRTSLRQAMQRLAKGHVVGMFPEGGIRDGAGSVLGGAPLRRGIRAVAGIAHAPVIPCVILGSDRLYRAAHWWPFRRVPIWIGFGDPVQGGGLGAEAAVDLETRLAEALRALCTEMRTHFRLTEDDLPKPPRERMRGR